MRPGRRDPTALGTATEAAPDAWRTLEVPPGGFDLIRGLAWATDSRHVATNGGGGPLLWDVTAGCVVRQFATAGGPAVAP